MANRRCESRSGGLTAVPGHACRAAALLLFVSTAACDEVVRSNPIPDGRPVAAIDCTVSVTEERLECADPTTSAGGARARILGGQGTYLRLASAGTTFDSTTREFHTDVTVQNLLDETLGTDGSTTSGIRVFFSQLPTAVGGAGGVVTLENADGEGVFMASSQPYFHYDVALKPFNVTSPRRWTFQVSEQVESFTFRVYVEAKTPSPGHVPARPATPAQVLVNGLPYSGTGALPIGSRVVLGNGLVRISQSNGQDSASHVMEAWNGSAWVALHSKKYGDWTYAGWNVVTAPTALDIVANADSLVGVRWTWANHAVPTRYGRPSYPYPVSKTIWLRAVDRGYYAKIDILGSEPDWAIDGEHEIGWGGVFGAATIRTSAVHLRTDTLTATTRLNLAHAVEAAEFDQDGSPWRRVLVPLPPDGMIIGVFSGTPHGLWTWGLGYRPFYGAYIHAALRESARPTREVCRDAIANSPFELPSMSAENCGPAL